MSEKKTGKKSAKKTQVERFLKSVWFFPSVLLIPVLLFSFLQINGSSIGFYHSLFYGEETKDNSLVFGKPRQIRSDEWLVNSQRTLAQDSIDYQRVNENIGNGEDTSIVIDVPYKDWSIIFKPHNLSFFLLPFDVAFALRWWLMGYLLIVSSYLLIATLLPDKRLFAAIISLAFFFSPFIQWWYLYGTLGTIYYSLFAAFIVIKLINSKKTLHKALLSVFLSYLVTAFALVLYPPFQIPVSIVVGAFTLGYIIESFSKKSKKESLINLGYILASLVVAILITFTYLQTRQDAVQSILNTSYPGDRSVPAGGFDIAHTFSGFLNYPLQFTSKAQNYSIPRVGVNNQSSSSNFLLLIPFLMLPAVVIQARDFIRKKEIDWPLLALTVVFGLFAARLFLPYLNPLYSLIQLDQVPHVRLLIGLGLLSLLFTAVFVRRVSKIKQVFKISYLKYSYFILIVIGNILLSVLIHRRSPEYISMSSGVLISLLFSAIIILLLQKKYVFSAILLLSISMLSSAAVNPLYRGTGVISDSEISQAIKTVPDKNGKWATESFIFENLPVANGAPSLSGVYTYPQLELWEDLNNQGGESDYNRYAHVIFSLDRNPSETIESELVLVSGDTFSINTEPCGDYLKQNDVRYLLLLMPLSTKETCVNNIGEISYPRVTFYIYEIQ